MHKNLLFDLLKKDHHEVDGMLKKMAKTKDEKERVEMLKEFEQEITLHMQLEEKLFYPELQKQQETQSQAKEALEEHQEARQLLKSLKSLHGKSEGWMPALEKLTEAVKHHVKEEEGEVFKAADQVLGKETLQAIGERFQEGKEKKLGMHAPKGPETRTRA